MRPSNAVRRVRGVVFGGMATLGMMLLFVGTLGLFPLDDGITPQQGILRTLPTLTTDYILVDVDGQDQQGYDPPWYWAASARPSYMLEMAPNESDLPAAVYARSTPLIDHERAQRTVRFYNTLRGVQFAGLPLLLVGGVGMSRLLRQQRKASGGQHEGV